jgi:hypothetical protein
VEKFRKKALIELVTFTPEGFLVQNEGDSSDQWVIDPDTFGTTYEKVEELNAVAVEPYSEPHEYLLFEALKVTNHDLDFDFRERVKAKLENLLKL